MIFDIINTCFILPNFFRKELENGTRFRFNSKYDFKRFHKPSDKQTIDYLTKNLSQMCQDTLGSVLPYPIFQGKNYHDKIIILLYPKGSDIPCAFNSAIAWRYQNKPCLHYGLFIVVRKHQKKGLQAPMGFINLVLEQQTYKNETCWMTDLGRSASGSRHFVSFMSDVCPRPINENGDCAPFEDFQLGLAKAFHDKFREDAGMSPSSKLVGFTVKGSNGEGGAEALVAVNGTTRSRNKKYNNWIDKVCPDKEDEVIMVGNFQLSQVLQREIGMSPSQIMLSLLLVFLLFVFLFVMKPYLL